MLWLIIPTVLVPGLGDVNWTLFSLTRYAGDFTLESMSPESGMQAFPYVLWVDSSGTEKFRVNYYSSGAAGYSGVITQIS